MIELVMILESRDSWIDLRFEWMETDRRVEDELRRN